MNNTEESFHQWYINNQTSADYIQSLSSGYFSYDVFDIIRKMQSFGLFDTLSEGGAHGRDTQKLRIIQNISLKFDQNAVDKIHIKDNRTYLSINGLGLLSINSPLPRHLIEYIFERVHLHGDKSWFEFVNFLQSRSLYLFYKSWDMAQNFNALDSHRIHQFDKFIASFIGLNTQSMYKNQHDIDIKDKLYFAGFYLNETKSAKNITQLLSAYFNVPIHVSQNIGIWHQVDKESQTAIGRTQFRLGEGLLLGDKIYDKQNKFRLIIGPVNLDTYKHFLRNGLYSKRLKAWMDFLAFSDFDWDYQLILLKQEVPSIHLNATNQIGQTAWLGRPTHHADNIIPTQDFSL